MGSVRMTQVTALVLQAVAAGHHAWPAGPYIRRSAALKKRSFCEGIGRAPPPLTKTAGPRGGSTGSRARVPRRSTRLHASSRMPVP
jgi:hypothetical protein